MTQQTTERAFSTLYFKQKELNGKPQDGKFETLRVRFLYNSISEIQAGRVHLYKYATSKFSKVLCLRNGLSKAKLDTVDCPLCVAEKFGTPSTNYYAFVEDLADDNKLKLFEMKWTLGKTIEEIADVKGKPLHDLVFILSKKGTGTATTYTAILDGEEKFSVRDYYASLGLSSEPTIVGPVADRAPIMALTREQIIDFMDDKYPWSTGERGESTTKKMNVLGSVVTTRGEASAAAPSIATQPGASSIPELDDLDITDEDDEVEEIDDRPSPSSFF